MEEQVERPSPEQDAPQPERRAPLLPPRPVRPVQVRREQVASPATPSELAHSLCAPGEAPAPPALDEGLVRRAVRLEELYEELAHLGTGGTGVVVLARDLESGEEVALKRLRRAEDGQRFLREARTIAALDHPTIVRLLRVVTTDDEMVALALEHVPGPDLESLVQREGALEPARALEVTRRLAEALAYAHGRGVVHRDVKPGNVLLLPDGRPKLTDFGLALAAAAHSLVETGTWCGTLDYMAPEQRSDADRVDGRADVYGLGATLYRLLTGTSPRVIREGRIPEPTRELVLRCVEEDPRERYPDMGAVIAALERALARLRADESDTRPPLERIAEAFQRRLERAERAEESRRLAVAAGGLAALGLLPAAEPGRSRMRLDMGEPWESELARLVAAVLAAARERGREASGLLADAHALLSTALGGVVLGERGRAALRLLDRKSRHSGRLDLAGRVGAALRRLIDQGLLPHAALEALREGQPGSVILLERLLAALRRQAHEASAEEWPRAEARWRRALETLGAALPEPELAERLRREGLALELERLQREAPPEVPPASRVG